MKGRVADIGDTLQDRMRRWPKASPEIRRQAAEFGIGQAELQEAYEVISDLAVNGDFQTRSTEAAWIPNDPYLSIVQSALEEAYLKADAVAKPTASGLAATSDPVTDLALKPDWIPTADRPLMRQGEETDYLGWGLSFAVAKGIAAFRGKAVFRRQGDPVPIKPKARLILFGDWASGVPRAAKVANQIAKQLADPTAVDRECHVIHLGDVYYAGRTFEYETHLGDLWPVGRELGDKVGSWCLNGNHDMFTGGHALFSFLDKDARFRRQNRCTYFALENENWIVLGLDTAYDCIGLKGDEGTLPAPQADWMQHQLAHATGKKVILLSHHQPFSAWENNSPQLIGALAPVLKGPKPVEAWFWGHEHRCAVYEPSHNVTYPALIGHGGVPVYASSKQPSGPKLRYHDNRSFTHMLEKFSYMGFAVLDLDGANATVRYIDEDGVARAEVDSIG
jgi:hypothetical protein